MAEMKQRNGICFRLLQEKLVRGMREAVSGNGREQSDIEITNKIINYRERKRKNNFDFKIKLQS